MPSLVLGLLLNGAIPDAGRCGQATHGGGAAVLVTLACPRCAASQIQLYLIYPKFEGSRVPTENSLWQEHTSLLRSFLFYNTKLGHKERSHFNRLFQRAGGKLLTITF